jgi:hypothetical protein
MLGVRGLIPGKGKILIFLIGSRLALVIPSLLYNCYQELFLLTEAARGEVHNSHPSIAEVKSGGVIPSLHHTFSLRRA